MKYPNRAIQCTKFLTITIQDKLCYKACNAINCTINVSEWLSENFEKWKR